MKHLKKISIRKYKMMNMMSLALVAVVAFTYFGGQNVPKVLKDNKQMVLGVFVGILLHQFMGVGVEGLIPGSWVGAKHDVSLWDIFNAGPTPKS